jgi:hypothetical protein
MIQTHRLHVRERIDARKMVTSLEPMLSNVTSVMRLLAFLEVEALMACLPFYSSSNTAINESLFEDKSLKLCSALVLLRLLLNRTLKKIPSDLKLKRASLMTKNYFARETLKYSVNALLLVSLHL